MWPNLQQTVDSVTFTEEILNRKLHFLYSDCVLWSLLPAFLAVWSFCVKIRHHFCQDVLWLRLSLDLVCFWRCCWFKPGTCSWFALIIFKFAYHSFDSFEHTSGHCNPLFIFYFLKFFCWKWIMFMRRRVCEEEGDKKRHVRQITPEKICVKWGRFVN